MYSHSNRHPSSSSSNNWYQPPSPCGKIPGYARSSSSTYPSYPATSRTMAYAKGAISSGRPSPYRDNVKHEVSGALQRRKPSSVLEASQFARRSVPPEESTIVLNSNITYSNTPSTTSEHYWAYRALTAEVRLAERSGTHTDALQRIKVLDARREVITSISSHDTQGN